MVGPYVIEQGIDLGRDDASPLSYAAGTSRDSLRFLARAFWCVCLLWGLMGLVELGLRGTSHVVLGPDESIDSWASMDYAIGVLLEAGQSLRDATLGPPQLLPGPEWVGILQDPTEWPGTRRVVDALATVTLPLFLTLVIASASRRRWLAAVGRASLLVAAGIVAWSATKSWHYSTGIWSMSGVCRFSPPSDTREQIVTAARLLAITYPMTIAMVLMALTPRRFGWPVRMGVALPLACFAAVVAANAGAALFEFTRPLDIWIERGPPAPLRPLLFWLTGTDEPDSVAERSRIWFAWAAAFGASAAAIGIWTPWRATRVAGFVGLVPLAALTGLVWLAAGASGKMAIDASRDASLSQRLQGLAGGLGQVIDWTPAIGLIVLAAVALIARRRALLDPVR